jgi:hypothetical protein
METTSMLLALKRTAILGILLLLPSFAHTQTTDSSAITDLLKEARAHAALAERDSETLESYTRSNVSWQAHANRLTEIQGHANDLINDFNQLKSMRDQGTPWQQEAIDRINPLLHNMGDHLTATIQHFNTNQRGLRMPAFREYVTANRELMSKTSKLIAGFVDYDEAMAKANALEKELDLPEVAQEHE